MNQNFLGRTVFYDKKNIPKKSFKTAWFLKKMQKKIFRKPGLPAKPDYLGNHANRHHAYTHAFIRYIHIISY